MNNNIHNIIDRLINNISTMIEVESIGVSGKPIIPKVGEGDIDIFIYCNEIPNQTKRRLIIDQLGNDVQENKIEIFTGGHWGVGDYLLIDGIETWLMYFTLTEVTAELNSILNGEYPDKLDYYYPIGRCAMLKNINVLYDKNGFLSDLKQKLSIYPKRLATILIQFHLEKLDDVEDLERAVVRKDVLFYHFALDIALDHFLQTLFAINRTFFPSRKRTLELTKDFNLKPKDFEKNILNVIQLGSFSDRINQSYSLWSNMVDELRLLGLQELRKD